MQKYTIHIDATLLSAILKEILEQLPGEYAKAYTTFAKGHPQPVFSRRSLISKWIGIPVGSSVLFKKIKQPVRIVNIFYQTPQQPAAEMKLYLNQYGIYGAEIADNLEEILPKTMDAIRFQIEAVPVSVFRTGFVDLEYLKDFDPVSDYLDPKHSGEVFTIGETEYCSIINLSDQRSVVIDDNNAVFLLNKRSGHIKLLFKRPGELITAIKNDTFAWLES